MTSQRKIWSQTQKFRSSPSRTEEPLIHENVNRRFRKYFSCIYPTFLDPVILECLTPHIANWKLSIITVPHRWIRITLRVQQIICGTISWPGGRCPPPAGLAARQTRVPQYHLRCFIIFIRNEMPLLMSYDSYDVM